MTAIFGRLYRSGRNGKRVEISVESDLDHAARSLDEAPPPEGMVVREVFAGDNVYSVEFVRGSSTTGLQDLGLKAIVRLERHEAGATRLTVSARPSRLATMGLLGWILLVVSIAVVALPLMLTAGSISLKMAVVIAGGVLLLATAWAAITLALLHKFERQATLIVEWATKLT